MLPRLRSRENFAIQSLELEVPAAQREISREKAAKFFQLALSYAIAGSEPMVLAVTGRVGTGKSSLAKVIGQGLGAEVLSSAGYSTRRRASDHRAIPG